MFTLFYFFTATIPDKLISKNQIVSDQSHFRFMNTRETLSQLGMDLKIFFLGPISSLK